MDKKLENKMETVIIEGLGFLKCRGTILKIPLIRTIVFRCQC